MSKHSFVTAASRIYAAGLSRLAANPIKTQGKFLTQGGGWGHSAEMFGFSCDHLLEAEIVDARGKMIIANRDCHPDLFWGQCKASGSSFPQKVIYC